MSDLLHVSSGPHVRAKITTGRIMLYVIIALLPTTIFGIMNFGTRALILLVATVLSCIISETVFNLIAKKKQTISDLSAVVTGMILALNMPVTLPVWEAVLGGVFAIVVVKMLFGGLGQNFMNPALGARCFLMIAFAGDMAKFKILDQNRFGYMYAGATPLAEMEKFKGQLIFMEDGQNTISNMFFGFTGGTIGETSALCLLIGGLFLIAMKVISVRIPLAYLGSFAVFMFLFGDNPQNVEYVVAQLLAGGIMFGALFMATDYVTSPITRKGQILFGICCGVLTGIFRCFGGTAEGVSFAIILSNLLVPLIEKITVPRAFGIEKKSKKEVK